MVNPPVLFDTCILIDYLRGIPQARTACNRYGDRAISIVTWMEILVGATAAQDDEARLFLLNFQLLPLTPDVAERAVEIRRSSKIKQPDAIIQATAQTQGRLLLTRNTRDFPSSAPGVHIPYTL